MKLHYNLSDVGLLPLGRHVMMTRNCGAAVWLSAWTRVRTTLPALLSIGVSVTPFIYGVSVNWCAQEPDKGVSEPYEANHFSMTEDADDPAVWEDVRAFEKAQTPETTRRALSLLDEKLHNWDSHPAGLITSILEVVGEHRIQAARADVVRCLYIDDRLEGSEFIRDTASRVLGMLGGSDAFQELHKLARQGSNEHLSSIATALGVLGDRRAIPLLEEFVVRPDAELRARALSSLAKFCSPTSKNKVIRAITDRDDRVRNSAVFWLSACAVTRDDQILMDRLEDPHSLVLKP